MPQNQPSMPAKDALQRLLDGLQTLMKEHLALARAELKDDVRTMGRDLLVAAAGVPALAVGYLMRCFEEELETRAAASSPLLH